MVGSQSRRKITLNSNRMRAPAKYFLFSRGKGRGFYIDHMVPVYSHVYFWVILPVEFGSEILVNKPWIQNRMYPPPPPREAFSIQPRKGSWISYRLCVSGYLHIFWVILSVEFRNGIIVNKLRNVDFYGEDKLHFYFLTDVSHFYAEKVITKPFIARSKSIFCLSF